MQVSISFCPPSIEFRRASRLQDKLKKLGVPYEKDASGRAQEERDTRAQRKRLGDAFKAFGPQALLETGSGARLAEMTQEVL